MLRFPNILSKKIINKQLKVTKSKFNKLKFKLIKIYFAMKNIKDKIISESTNLWLIIK